MPIRRAVLCCLALLLSVSFAWCLSEGDQAGTDKLLADTVLSLTTGQPQLWSLFSTQGSTAVIGAADGFVAAGRGRLKNDAATAATFTLPAGVKVVSSKLHRTGDFILGRVTLEAPLPPRPVVFPEGPALKDVWTAFMRPDSQFLAGVRKPAEEPVCIAPAPEPTPDQWEATIVAVQDGANSSWRYLTLEVAPLARATDEGAIQAVVECLRAWERSMLQGDVSPLAQSLYPDPFLVAAATPDGQSWFFTYPEYLTTMLGSALAMGSADKSQMMGLNTTVSGTVATIIGNWAVEIPMFGSLTWNLAATLVKAEDRWMLVSMCAGMVEG